MADAAAALAEWERDPLRYSQLAYWLGLEVWSREEGLLVLAGVEPGTVVEVPPGSFNEIDGQVRWEHAQPFSEHWGFGVGVDPLDLELSDFDGDADAFDAYLERCESHQEIVNPLRLTLAGLHHRLAHSPSGLGDSVSLSRWRPQSFIAWGLSFGFRPSWYDWAEENGLLPGAINLDQPPFFDPDSSDYPLLLHIAVRAWEAARSSSEGTPKQRIEKYLKQSYPTLSPAARAAIAQVVNWRKAGGRPKRS